MNAEVNDIHPSSLTHLGGNHGVLEQVRIALDAAFEDHQRMDHALLLGPPGMGKSSLAHVISQELAVPFHEVLGQNLRTTADLNTLLLQAEEKSVVHIDEIHEAPQSIQTALYMALDKRQVMVRNAGGINSLPLTDFTLLLSTTEEHDLLQPLRDRMRLTLRFDYYSADELAQAASKRARALGWLVQDSVFEAIAARAKGTPRIALKLLQAARRVSRAGGETVVTLDHLQHACRLENVDNLGLGFLEQRYLRLLLDGPRRVNVLASSLGVPTKTLTSVNEPFMIRLGLVEKDDQSRRMLTPKGREHVIDTDR